MASLSQWGGWNPEFKAEIADFMRVGIEVCGGKATQNSLPHRGMASFSLRRACRFRIDLNVAPLREIKNLSPIK